MPAAPDTGTAPVGGPVVKHGGYQFASNNGLTWRISNAPVVRPQATQSPASSGLLTGPLLTTAGTPARPPAHASRGEAAPAAEGTGAIIDAMIGPDVGGRSGMARASGRNDQQ